MTAPPERVREKVRAWVARADEDLRVARHTLALADQCPYGLVAFLSQQCAEKYLKAFLVSRRVDFPYTHNIARLLELCAGEAAWAAELQDAAELTPFAITARYPGDNDPVTTAEAHRSPEIAARVREVVRRALCDDGLAL
jgi:HEPN domain-containing protein